MKYMTACIFVNSLALISLLTLALLGTFYKHIPFGAGLGDLLIYAIIYLILFVHSLILTIFFVLKFEKRCNILRIAYTAFMLWVAIYFWLKATIWRGPEYSWNGSLFYVPCPEKFMIITETDTIFKLGTLCTGDHISTIEGKWTGSFMLIKNSSLDIPEELTDYIKFPFSKVYIKPSHDGALFNPDTLSIDELYAFDGQIIGIKDSALIMSVSTIKVKR